MIEFLDTIFRQWIVPTIHWGVIVAAFASPWFLPWFIILLMLALYYIQILVFKGCILSKLQFKDGGKFWHYYIRKVFPNVSEKRLNIIVDAIFPIIIVLLTLLFTLK